MRIVIAAAGKLKPSPEQALCQRYFTRNRWNIQLKECSTHADIFKAAGKCERIIMLDERGENASSAALAAKITQWQNHSISSIACIIGDAHGFSDEERAQADWLLALGAQTWPHKMVRAMLAEQIYRAHTIIDRHPYHHSS